MAGSSVPQFASVYVGDLHPDVTEAMLYEIFNSVGPVGSIRVCRDSVTRKSLGYGYVNFHSVSDAEKALDTLNYSSIKGRSCRIMWSQRDPTLRKSGAGNIFVNNLDKNIDNKALFDTFSLFGNILSCKVASDPTGKSYGYGFVHYETEEAAKQAIERVNGMQIGEKTVQVTEHVKRESRAAPDTENYTNLYVKHFPQEWEEEKVNEIFADIGPIKSAAIRTDMKGRKFAFVDYEKAEDAKKAVETLHMKDLRSDVQKEKEEEKDPDGHPVGFLYCQRAQTKAERQVSLREKYGGEAASSGVNLFVKNLDDTTTDEQLKELFDPYGKVLSAACPKDETGKCKGFGFVSYSSPDEATKAVTEMHLKVVSGKPLYICLAEKREAREERMKNRFGKGGKGGKGGGKGKGGGGPGPGAMNPQQVMYNPMMMGPRPQGMPMMGPCGKGGPMMPQMMMMPGKGGPMMPPQVMAMMQKGGQMMPNPQMMAMMQKGGPMMMRPQMPAQQPQGARPPMPAAQPPAQGGTPLTASALAAAPPSVQKQMIGEKLFPAVSKYQPELAGKITGMMLEMDNSELLMLLESEQQLKQKVDEAMRVISSK